VSIVTPDLFRGPSFRRRNACTSCGNMDAGTRSHGEWIATAALPE
jgi:hypothetical protein